MTEPSSPSPGSTPPPTSNSSLLAAPPAYAGPPPDKDSKTMAMLCHLLSIVTSFLGPLIIWLLKKDTSPFVDDQGKESLNFQLTCLIGYVIAHFTMPIFCLGLLIFPVVGIFHLIFAIIAAMKANDGIAYRYPICIRFVK